MKHTYSEEALREAVKESLSIAGVLRCLNLRPAGGNYKIVQRRLKDFNIDTSHFTGRAWNTGIRYRKFCKEFTNEEVFQKNSPVRSGNAVRNRLLKIRERKCERCNNSKWLEYDIPIEVHHINGVNTDHRLENLQLLCPNCHALTDNYRGKNPLSALSERRGVEYRKFRETFEGDNINGNPELSLVENEESAESRHGKPKSKKPRKLKVCPECNKEFPGSNVYCSRDCYDKNRRSNLRPSVFQLLEDFKERKSFLKVAEKYGISDNAVRKWCRLYGILDMVKGYSRPQTSVQDGSE